MARGRKALAEPRVRVEVRIPEVVLAKVSLVLMDPVRGGRKYGSLGDLTTQLLREWLKSQGVDA